MPVSSGGFLLASRVQQYSRMATRKIIGFRVRGYYSLWHGFPAASANQLFFYFPIYIRHHLTTPGRESRHRVLKFPQHSVSQFSVWFGLLPFRSPLLGEYFRLATDLFIFLQVLRCFTSLGALPNHQDWDHSFFTSGVSPFGKFRIKGC